MIIRQLLDNELNLLATMDQEVNLSPWSLINYQQSQDNPSHTIAGIFTPTGILVGGCVYSQVIDQGEILQLCVAKSRQRQGYAQKLLITILNEMATKGIDQVFLEVMIDNIPAINLYQQIGFNQISKRSNYYLINGRRYDALIMGKSVCHA